MEEWRRINEFPDYEVSNLGHVRRATPGRKTYVGKLLKPIRTGAYPGVSLVRDGKAYRRYVHRLVAAAFIGPCPDGHEVNHKDGNKTAPAASNLEYITRSGNVRHALDTGLKVPKRGVDSVLWKGGPQIGPGRPSGGAHWMRRNPELIRRGEAAGNAKLTVEQVTVIRQRAAAGERQSVIAADVGLSRAQICRIVGGTRWAA